MPKINLIRSYVMWLIKRFFNWLLFSMLLLPDKLLNVTLPGVKMLYGYFDYISNTEESEQLVYELCETPGSSTVRNMIYLNKKRNGWAPGAHGKHPAEVKIRIINPIITLNHITCDVYQDHTGKKYSFSNSGALVML